MRADPKHIVISIHGVRRRWVTRWAQGDWQASLRRWLNARDPALVVISHRYWFRFAIVQWLMSSFNGLFDPHMRGFIKRLKVVRRRYPKAIIHLVGHSRGTDIIHKALARCYPEVEPIGNIFLIAGITSSHIQNTVYANLLEQHIVARIVAFYSKKDIVVKLAPPPSGHLGYNGFVRADHPSDFVHALYKPYDDLEVYNHEFDVGHCGYFTGEAENVTFGLVYEGIKYSTGVDFATKGLEFGRKDIALSVFLPDGLAPKVKV